LSHIQTLLCFSCLSGRVSGCCPGQVSYVDFLPTPPV
jgi:hypothetical protein